VVGNPRREGDRTKLRTIARKGLRLLLCLLQAKGLAALLAKLAEIIGLNRLQNLDQRWALA
jgi:transposase, IS5 family